MQRNRNNLHINVENDHMEDSFTVGAGGSLKNNESNNTIKMGKLQVSEDGVRMDGSSDKYKIEHEKITVIKRIGQGTSSMVYLAKHNENNILMALKMISIYERNKRHQIFKEIVTYYHAECPTLVEFYGAYFHEGNINIAIEFMDQGCLGTVLQKYGPIPEPVLAAMAFQCLWGLGYLKFARRVHRDIKPQNILCDSRGQVKLTDFGISKELENSIGLCQTFVGTFKYMSPERIRSESYGYASDLWSLGLVLLECFTGRYPYPECNIYIDMVQTILDSEPSVPNNSNISPEMREFVTCCLQKDPSRRMPAEYLLESPWLQQNGCVDLSSCQNTVRQWFQQHNQPVTIKGLVPTPPSAQRR